MPDLIFNDTETTSLERNADIWEFAGVRRNTDGTSEELHLFIKHSRKKADQLPAEFRADLAARFPYDPATKGEAAVAIANFLARRDGKPKPVWVGSAPDFDAQRVERMLRRHVPVERGRWTKAHGYEWIHWAPEWDHQLVGVVPLMLGYYGPAAESLALPHKSEELSRALGVNPDDFERHTAMGDVLWTMAIYDRIMGGADHG